MSADPSNIPSGWGAADLGSLVEFKYGKALPAQNRSGVGFAVFGSNGQVGLHHEALTKGPTIIVGRKGSVGEVHYSPLACSPIDTTYFIDDVPGNQFLYWNYLLRSLGLSDLNKSTAIPGLSRADAYKIKVPVPPEAEQRRIADKLDSVLARVEAVNDRLARVAPLLKRFRQSVLAAATSGRLTEEWRIETGLEAAWKPSTIGEVIAEMRNGLATKPDENPQGTPILRISAVRPGMLDINDHRFLTLNSGDVSNYSLRVGDLLYTRYNGSLEFVGVCALVRAVGLSLVYPDKLIRVRVDEHRVLPAFLEIASNTPAARKQVEGFVKSSAGQKGIAGGDLKRLAILLPSLAEQTEIVRRVELLFAYADRLETRLQAAQTAAERLTPALLTKAFRGELVPQDPSDEPAGELLRRLTENSAETSSSGKRGRKSKA